jgi:hypothetical protein
MTGFHGLGNRIHQGGVTFKVRKTLAEIHGSVLDRQR